MSKKPVFMHNEAVPRIWTFTFVRFYHARGHFIIGMTNQQIDHVQSASKKKVQTPSVTRAWCVAVSKFIHVTPLIICESFSISNDEYETMKRPKIQL